MPDVDPQEITLKTLHQDLTGLRGEVREGLGEVKADLKAAFADLKATLVGGFRGLPTRETAEEMVRLLRESNRLQEERLVQLDAARLDPLIRGRGDGSPTASPHRTPRLPSSSELLRCAKINGGPAIRQNRSSMVFTARISAQRSRMQRTDGSTTSPNPKIRFPGGGSE